MQVFLNSRESMVRILSRKLDYQPRIFLLVRYLPLDLLCAHWTDIDLLLDLAHLVAMPVWEQGGMEDWTLAAKVEETNWFAICS